MLLYQNERLNQTCFKVNTFLCTVWFLYLFCALCFYSLQKPFLVLFRSLLLETDAFLKIGYIQKKQHIKVHFLACFSKAVCFFVMSSCSAAQSASLIESSSLYFLMSSFSFLIVFSVIRSLLWLTLSSATLPQASAVRVLHICSFVKQIFLLYGFFIPPCFLPLALPRCFCNLKSCSDLL